MERSRVDMTLAMLMAAGGTVPTTVSVSEKKQGGVSGRVVGRGKVTLRNKVGRNDTCPCGSGRKYKKCCLGE